MANFCCVTWQSLAGELKKAKEKELRGLSRKGIPASVFAPVTSVMEAMTQYCPVCGSRLTQSAPSEGKPAPKKAKEVNLEDVEVPPHRVVSPAEDSPEIHKPIMTCIACKGKGNFGVDANGIETKCMRCFGTGVITLNNSPKGSI